MKIVFSLFYELFDRWMPDEFRNVDCQQHCFPLTPLPYAEENLPSLCSCNDGGERESSV